MHAGFFRDLESDGPVLSLHDDQAFLPLDVDLTIRGKHRGGLNGGPEDLAVNEAGLWHAALDRDRKTPTGECSGKNQRGKNNGTSLMGREDNWAQFADNETRYKLVFWVELVRNNSVCL